MSSDVQGVIDTMLRSIQYMLDKTLKSTTEIYDALIISNNNDGRWNVQFNGINIPVKPYGSITPTVGSMVKVFIPQGNKNLAFFI